MLDINDQKYGTRVVSSENLVDLGVMRFEGLTCSVPTDEFLFLIDLELLFIYLLSSSC
jgi:hypothetical protein